MVIIRAEIFETDAGFSFTSAEGEHKGFRIRAARPGNYGLNETTFFRDCKNWKITVYRKQFLNNAKTEIIIAN